MTVTSSSSSSHNDQQDAGVFAGVTAFLGRFLRLGTQCSSHEVTKAEQVRTIHNLIEEVAYNAFAVAVIDFDIKRDSLTAEQSGQILSRIKMAAHREMYKKDGYIAQRSQLLDPSQVEEVIRNVGRIVHDRDTKLTNARYYCLSELLMGLDDHNTMVKVILLQSWFKCSHVCDPDHDHLEEVKRKIDFYPRMDRQLTFNLKETLACKKVFWDRFFPGTRQAVDHQASIIFVNTIEVRHFCGGEDRVQSTSKSAQFVTNNQPYSINEDDLKSPFVTLLCPDDADALFNPRQVTNMVRRQDVEMCALVTNRDITTRQFLMQYFPEKEEAMPEID